MRPTGYLPDAPDARDLSASGLYAAGPLPESVSLRGHVGEVLEQRHSDCVANALAKALQVLWSLQGEQAPTLISRLALYREARAYHGAGNVDAGTMPRLAFKALRAYGFAPESVWSYDNGVNAAPNVNLYRSSFATAETLQYARCSDDPVQRVTQLWQGLAALKPAVVGLTLDKAFSERPGDLWEYSGPSTGRHMMAAVGADSDGLLVVNSWGAGWGDKGFCRIAWATVADPKLCSDPYILTTCPKPTEETHAS